MDGTFFLVLKSPGVRRWCLTLGLAGMLASCSSMPESEEVAVTEPVKPTAKVSLGEWTLLEMNFDEAKAISSQHAEVGPLFRVAGDTIEVLKTDAEGKPLKVKAKGHVFLEMTLANRATALCDEAEITLEKATLHGNPMLMQASRVAKATTESTSFSVTDHLRVSGRFDLIGPEDLMQSILASSKPLPTAPTLVEAPKTGS